MRSLYITQTGMAENLGQSQVLPYLRGLAKRGIEVDLVSYELGTLKPQARDELAHQIEKGGIRWHPLIRRMPGSLPVKMKESAQGVLKSLASAVRRRPDIIHGRSYLASAICDASTFFAPGSKLLFDCRGMLGDEYVDGGYWTTDRLEYKLLKAYEKRLFHRSDGIVVLTNALRRWLTSHHVVGHRPTFEVVPCCVDLERFSVRDDERARLRLEHGLGDAFVILYSGSLGNWYLEPEMARFAKAIRDRVSGRVVFACFSPSDTSGLRAELEKVGFSGADVIVKKLAPKEIASYLSLGDIGLSFIKNCFSKTGSSPTKVAEYLGCGNIAVVNGDIGDQADLATEADACVVLANFGDDEIAKAADRAVVLAQRPRAERAAAAAAAARRQFDLEEVGVARYARLYERLVK